MTLERVHTFVHNPHQSTCTSAFLAAHPYSSYSNQVFTYLLNSLSKNNL